MNGSPYRQTSERPESNRHPENWSFLCYHYTTLARWPGGLSFPAILLRALAAILI